MIAERPSTFEEFQIYGFAAQVEVPAMTPTASSNGFFLELGFNATDTTQRPAAAYIEVTYQHVYAYSYDICISFILFIICMW